MKNTFNPFFISEDDKLRSNHVQMLVHEEPHPISSLSQSTIPKTIIQFWHNLNELPEDVKECINSWNLLSEEGFKILLYDTKTAKEFIKEHLGDIYFDAFNNCSHPAMQCDYFRLCYILVYGGFYVDVDEVFLQTDINHLFRDEKLKLQPLCYEISTGLMISPDRFMRMKETSNDWIFYLNNNPIISPPQHPIILLALERATSKLLGSNSRINDIQSTTGPGNITASLVKHSLILEQENLKSDFYILPYWESISKTKWALSYRNDERNWRIWDFSKRWDM